MFGLMFVSTHIRVVRHYIAIAQEWNEKHNQVVHDFNRVIRQINAKGGRAFLEDGEIHPKKPAPPFTMDELKSLISLCHPDKHGGKESATRMTQILLKMKSDLE